jgi:cytochrome P450
VAVEPYFYSLSVGFRDEVDCFAVISGIFDRPLDNSFKKYHRLTLSILRSFGFGDHGVMETRINSEVEDLVAELGKYNSEPVYPLAIINGSVVNVIASILFGRRFERYDPVLNELVMHTNAFGRGLMTVFPVHLFPFLKFVPPFSRRIDEFFAVQAWLLEFLGQKIDEVLSSLADGSAQASFIRSFIEEEGADRYDRDELLFLLRDMIVAGSETSSTAVLWMLTVMAEYPDVQRRMQEEIDAVVGDRGVGEGSGFSVGRRLPSLADKPKLPYVEATILELMRFKNVTPVSVPRETVADTIVGGYLIPASTMVV